MIYVTLGTQDKEFKRILNLIEKAIIAGTINEKVIAQIGYTEYKTDLIELHQWLTPEEMNNYFQESSYVICHGGVGSIVQSLQFNKKVIVVPRLEKYNEHVNDHQLQITENFEKKGYILACYDDNLDTLISKLKQFEPKKYKSNNSGFCHLLESTIESLIK